MPGGRALVIVIVAAFAVLYGVVVALYAWHERNTTVEGCNGEAPADAVLIKLTPESVNASTDRIVTNLEVLSFGPIGADETGLLTEPLTVLVSDTDGPRTFTIAQDEIPSPQSVNFITTGFIEQWPFDAHTVDIAVVSSREVDGVGEVIPTVLCGSAHVPGWDFSSQEVAGTNEIVIDGQPVTQVRITATRSGATIAFGIVILVLMTVLPVIGLTVAIVAYRGLRKVEATLMSWLAAMLFATIPLRTFLPGSPPIGSWVDYLVVLWVVAGLVLALVIYVRAWLRWSTPGARASVDGAGAVAVAIAAAPAAEAVDSSTSGDGAAD